ncbi:hypothetical protein H0H93_010820 [Arthromyces matolae]|nr:hypothetical protein H0H93_010820 [Arthromyces matolae]
MPPLYRTIKRNGRRTSLYVLAVPFPYDDIVEFTHRNGIEGNSDFDRVILGLEETTKLLKNYARPANVYRAADPDDSVTAFYFAHNKSQTALDLARNPDTLKKIYEVLGVKYRPIWVHKAK